MQLIFLQDPPKMRQCAALRRLLHPAQCKLQDPHSAESWVTAFGVEEKLRGSTIDARQLVLNLVAAMSPCDLPAISNIMQLSFDASGMGNHSAAADTDARRRFLLIAKLRNDCIPVNCFDCQLAGLYLDATDLTYGRWQGYLNVPAIKLHPLQFKQVETRIQVASSYSYAWLLVLEQNRRSVSDSTSVHKMPQTH